MISVAVMYNLESVATLYCIPERQYAHLKRVFKKPIHLILKKDMIKFKLINIKNFASNGGNRSCFICKPTLVFMVRL